MPLDAECFFNVLCLFILSFQHFQKCKDGACVSELKMYCVKLDNLKVKCIVVNWTVCCVKINYAKMDWKDRLCKERVCEDEL